MCFGVLILKMEILHRSTLHHNEFCGHFYQMDPRNVCTIQDINSKSYFFVIYIHSHQWSFLQLFLQKSWEVHLKPGWPGKPVQEVRAQVSNVSSQIPKSHNIQIYSYTYIHIIYITGTLCIARTNQNRNTSCLST